MRQPFLAATLPVQRPSCPNMMMTLSFTMYSRPGCHLCDEMRQLIERELADQFASGDCSLEEVDISSSIEMEAKYGLQIPVLFVNGERAFEYRITPEQLRARVDATR